MSLVGILSVFLITLILNFIIISTKSLHGKITNDDSQGVQKFHKNPTPRIGGLALILGLSSTLFFSDSYLYSYLLQLILCSIPIFLFGFLEDLFGSISPIWRLIASFISAFFLLVSGYNLTDLDIWGSELIFKNIIISYLFTSFAIAGVIHSTNIIDGFNGLASGTILICSSSLYIS